jgi:hypothetical protein
MDGRMGRYIDRWIDGEVGRWVGRWRGRSFFDVFWWQNFLASRTSMGRSRENLHNQKLHRFLMELQQNPEPLGPVVTGYRGWGQFKLWDKPESQRFA